MVKVRKALLLMVMLYIVGQYRIQWLNTNNSGLQGARGHSVQPIKPKMAVLHDLQGGNPLHQILTPPEAVGEVSRGGPPSTQGTWKGDQPHDGNASQHKGDERLRAAALSIQPPNDLLSIQPPNNFRLLSRGDAPESGVALPFAGHPSMQERLHALTNCPKDGGRGCPGEALHCGFLASSGYDDVVEAAEGPPYYQCGVVVATAVFGGKNFLIQPKEVPPRLSDCFFAFVDTASVELLEQKNYHGVLSTKEAAAVRSRKRVGVWRLLVVRGAMPFNQARKDSRIPKMLLHRLFPQANYSLWIDAKNKLLVDPQKMVRQHLIGPGAVFAALRNNGRTTIDQEYNWVLNVKCAGQHSQCSCVDGWGGRCRVKGLMDGDGNCSSVELVKRHLPCESPLNGHIVKDWSTPLSGPEDLSFQEALLIGDRIALLIGDKRRLLPSKRGSCLLKSKYS